MAKYQIMQIKNVDHCEYAFRTYKKERFNLSDYTVVHEGEINRPDDNDYDICERLFYQFNVDRPKDYTGRSLSVSDIVVILDDGYEARYYCDFVGWIQIK